ncbi:MAG: DUF61 family protein [Halobacteriota archaeon]|nr:DUF61 family protein [Halobacteriota archaeon]
MEAQVELRDTNSKPADLKIIQSLNKHLPPKRKTLGALLAEDKPRVFDKEGSSHRFKKDELRLIAEIIPEKYHELVRLPIYIEMTPDYGSGTAVIRGYHNCSIVQSVLDMEKEKTDEIIIYRPDVRRLRQVLKTTTQYSFFISSI